MAVNAPLLKSERNYQAWIFPALLLAIAYSLLGLTQARSLSHADMMQRCVLVDPAKSRIWSVGHIEIGLAYLGVFVGMAVFVLRAARHNRQHLTDLALAFAYLFGSFALDYFCVAHFTPFFALLIGDAVVMTFALVVSRQLWFQRLLGVFVPLVFFTCAVGHFMEGLSYWTLTYPVNVPWTMVTADIGFAILVNASRFPAFIRGQDIVSELEEAQREAKTRQLFFRDVMLSATEGHLRLCSGSDDLPVPLPLSLATLPITFPEMPTVRHRTAQAAQERGFSREEIELLQTAVGEAVMNAVVHGNGGQAEIRASHDTLQVWIEDKGTGIHLAELPRATLEKGYSTKDSLGHGFWLMLRSCDSVDLLTSSQGTRLVITLKRSAAQSSRQAV